MSKDAGKTNRSAAPPIIVKCGCESNQLGNTAAAQFQDELYKKGNRVANPNNNGYSCTVCGRSFPLMTPAQ